MNKKNLLAIGLVFCIASVLYLATPTLAPTSPPFDLYNAVKDIQTKANWIWGGLQSLQTTLDGANNNLKNVKVETVIYGPVLNFSEEIPAFNITANQPWDLMAVYVTTYGFNDDGGADKLHFGTYYFGSRSYLLFKGVLVADGKDVTDFPIFPSDMTNGTQSIIPVPANVPVCVTYGMLTWYGEKDQSLSYKIVIQRPIDPSFSYTVKWGY